MNLMTKIFIQIWNRQQHSCFETTTKVYRKNEATGVNSEPLNGINGVGGGRLVLLKNLVCNR